MPADRILMSIGRTNQDGDWSELQEFAGSISKSHASQAGLSVIHVRKAPRQSSRKGSEASDEGTASGI